MANLESPMAGKIMEINCAVGDTIAEDDEFIVLEAMKMENPIFAAEGGVVKEIKVKEGQVVAEGEVLVVLEQFGSINKLYMCGTWEESLWFQ